MKQASCLIQMESAQQDCGGDDPGERMYMWSESMSPSLSISHTLLGSSLAFNSGSQGKTRGDTPVEMQADKPFFASGQNWNEQCLLYM